MRAAMQERFQVYVMGPPQGDSAPLPNQDARLASIAPGQVIEKINLKLDLDAPFILRRRALRQKYVNEIVGELGTQNGLQFLKTRWTGPKQDYRQGDLMVLESLQSSYYGQVGCPKPVSPEIAYPPGGIITLDLINTGPSTITNLTFYWIGVNLYPWGALPSPSYPSEFRATTFGHPFMIPQLSAPEIRLNQPYKVKPDGDFVIRGAQAAELGQVGDTFINGVLQPASEMFIRFKDYNGHAYMNDWVDINILFGQSAFLSAYPVGPGPSFQRPFGTGPGNMGIIYPEIYLPAERQLLVDVFHACNVPVGGPEDLLINWIGAKVFKGARE